MGKSGSKRAKSKRRSSTSSSEAAAAAVHAVGVTAAGSYQIESTNSRWFMLNVHFVLLCSELIFFSFYSLIVLSTTNDGE